MTTFVEKRVASQNILYLTDKYYLASAHYRNLDVHSFDLNSVFLKSLNRKSSIIGACYGIKKSRLLRLLVDGIIRQVHVSVGGTWRWERGRGGAARWELAEGTG